MIRINSKTLIQTVTKIRLMLGLKRHSSSAVVVSSTSLSTTVAMQTANCSIACELDIPNLPHRAHAQLSSLQNVKPSDKHEIALRQHGEDLKIRYWDAAKTRSEDWQAAKSAALPPTADCWLDNPVQLGQTLFDLAQLADDQSTRYALGCLRLRGSDGQIAVTDGRIACVHDGFALPFEEALVPVEHLKRMKLLTKCKSVEVGSSAGWLHLKLVVGTARWWIDIRLQTAGRYPTIDQCFPRTTDARTIVNFSENDAQFLIDNLSDALGTDFQPITLEAGQSGRSKTVSIRLRGPAVKWLSEHTGQDAEKSPYQIVELQLTSSSFERLTRQATFNHRNLIAALKLGFREFHIPSYPAPAFCHQPNRKLVFTIYPVDLALSTGHQSMVVQSCVPLAHAG